MGLNGNDKSRKGGFWGLFKRPEQQSELVLQDFLNQLVTWFSRNHPDISLVAMANPSHTVIRVDKQEVLVDFGGLFAWFKRDPAALDSILGDFIMEVVEEMRNRAIPCFEDVLDRIYPQVRHFDFLRENSPRFGKGRLSRLALTDDLFVLFVMDESRGMTFVNEGHLDIWGIGAPGLSNIARRNLAILGRKLDGQGRLIDQSGFAAAHLLQLEELLHLTPGDEVLVGIPHRDSLYTLDVNANQSRQAALALEIEQQYRVATRPISANLYTCRAKIGGGMDMLVAGLATADHGQLR